MLPVTDTAHNFSSVHEVDVLSRCAIPKPNSMTIISSDDNKSTH